MTQQPAAPDWATLGIAPTTDADELRRAYRARLKVVKPESDPEGFQALRQAYERLLDSLQHVQAGQESGDASAAAEDFVDALQALRHAGDGAGALSLARTTLQAQQPGSAELEAIEDALMDQVAFDRCTAPPLFLLLVDHFDWRDIQGRVARADPERHAALLDRIGAEDWITALQQAAAAGEQVPSLMLAPYSKALALLKAGGLQAGGAAEVRTRFDELLTHASFVLMRFDAATLALVREAVEGPPLLGEPRTAALPGRQETQMASAADGGMPTVSKKNNRRIIVAVVVVVLAMVGSRMLWKAQSAAGGKLPDTSLAAEVAATRLKDPARPWLATRKEPAGIFVDWAPILKMRRGVAELRIGVNMDEPSGAMTLPEWDAPIGFVASKEIKYITMRVRYQDGGEWSEVRRYPIWEGKP